MKLTFENRASKLSGRIRAVAEFERAKIADRMRRGMKHAVIKNGQVLGNKAPYGYRFVRKSDTTPAHWEVDPQEAELVRLVFHLYVNKKMTGASIARHLKSKGIYISYRFTT